MVCEEIRERLSAYLEGTLSPEDRAAIKNHLNSCSRCSETLSDLSKTLEHVKNLEEVTPPPWLTQKVMDRIRAEARPGKSLFRRLFYPLHVKLPIEAVATVLVIGLALYIYRDIAPEVKLAQVPVEKSAPQVSREPQQPVLRDTEGKGVTPPVLPLDKGRNAEGLSLKESERGSAVRRAPAPEKLEEQPPLSKETEVKANELARSRVLQAEKREEAKAPAAAGKIGEAPGPGALAKDEARQEVRAAAPKAKLSYTEKKKEELFVLTVLVRDPETAVKAIEKTLKDLEGKAIRTESVEGKKVVSAMLKANKIHELSERLKMVGEIREKKLDMRGREEEVRVHVEVTANQQRP